MNASGTSIKLRLGCRVRGVQTSSSIYLVAEFPGSVNVNRLARVGYDISLYRGLNNYQYYLEGSLRVPSRDL